MRGFKLVRQAQITPTCISRILRYVREHASRKWLKALHQVQVLDVVPCDIGIVQSSRNKCKPDDTYDGYTIHKH